MKDQRKAVKRVNQLPGYSNDVKAILLPVEKSMARVAKNLEQRKKAYEARKEEPLVIPKSKIVYPDESSEMLLQKVKIVKTR